MNGKIEISVVIPTYNRAHILRRAIDHALSQTFPPLEIIVVDDGSTDGTEELMAFFKDDSRVRYLRQKTTRGAAEARNRGVAEARGQWIAFLDSDDFWLPQKLERQIGKLVENPGPRQISFHQVITENNVTPEGRPFRGLSPGEKVGDYLFCHGGLIQTSSLLGRREIFEKTPFDPNLPRHQDWDLCLQLEAAGIGFLFVREVLAVWACDPAANRVSNKKDAANSLAWMKSHSHLLSPAAQQAFLAEVVAPAWHATGQKGSALRQILKAGLNGSISAKSMLRLLLSLWLPRPVYDRLRKVPFRLRSKKA